MEDIQKCSCFSDLGSRAEVSVIQFGTKSSEYPESDPVTVHSVRILQ